MQQKNLRVKLHVVAVDQHVSGLRGFLDVVRLQRHDAGIVEEVPLVAVLAAARVVARMEEDPKCWMVAHNWYLSTTIGTSIFAVTFRPRRLNRLKWMTKYVGHR